MVDQMTTTKSEESDAVGASSRGTGAVESRGSDGDDSVTDAVAADRPLLSFFIPDLTVGGAEQVTVTIVNGLAARGYTVELLLSRFEGELESELSDQVEVVELSPARTSVFGVAAHLPALAAYLRRRKPAALFPQLEHPSVVVLTLNRFLDVDSEVIPTHHSAFGKSVDQTAKDRIVGELVPRLYPASDRIVAVSGGVADSIVDQTPVERTGVSVLHNPVDVELVRERASERVDHEWIEDDDTDVVLFVGRHADQKNLETWLRAFERIHDRDPAVRGVVAGTGPASDDLQELAETLGLSDVVSFPGYVDNPYRFMAQADAFLLSSRYEGLPTVLIEALAVGCPVVSTDCPSGPREILADGAYGRLVPVGDVQGLADAVTGTLVTPPDPATLRARADDFAPDTVFDEYERFIERHVQSN